MDSGVSCLRFGEGELVLVILIICEIEKLLSGGVAAFFSLASITAILHGHRHGFAWFLLLVWEKEEEDEKNEEGYV